MGQHYPPSLEQVAAESTLHVKKNESLAQIFALHQAILEAQFSFLERINISVDMNEEELKNLFREEKFVLSSQKADIDPGLFKELLLSVCKAIKKASPEAPDAILNLDQADAFKEENIADLIKDVALFSKEELIAYIEDKQINVQTGLDSEVLSFIIFMALTPFYSLFAEEILKITDFSFWRQGYCPVCGQTATMARHRTEDGARILECWLCHAQWVFPRMECPFCDNKDQKKLRFFYVEGDKLRQVHVCEECKKYLKTIDGKSMGKDVLLSIEAIATTYLDELAVKEGYIPPAGVVQLN